MSIKSYFQKGDDRHDFSCEYNEFYESDYDESYLSDNYKVKGKKTKTVVNTNTVVKNEYRERPIKPILTLEMLDSKLGDINDEILLFNTQQVYENIEINLFLKLEEIFLKGVCILVYNMPSDHNPVEKTFTTNIFGKYISKKVVTWNLETKYTFIDKRLQEIKKIVMEYINSKLLYEKIGNINLNTPKRLEAILDAKYLGIIDKLIELQESGVNEIYFQECDMELFKLIEKKETYSIQNRLMSLKYKYNKIIPRNYLKYSLKEGKNIQNFKQEIAKIFIGKDIDLALENYTNDLFLQIQEEIKNKFDEYYEENNNHLDKTYGVGLMSNRDFIILPTETYWTYGFDYWDIDEQISEYSVNLLARNALIIFEDDIFKKNKPEKKTTIRKKLYSDIIINCHSKKENSIEIENYIKGEIFNYDNYIMGFYEKLFNEHDLIPGIKELLSEELKDKHSSIEKLITRQIRKKMYISCNQKLNQSYPDSIELIEDNYDYKNQYFINMDLRNHIMINMSRLLVIGDFNNNISKISKIFITQHIEYNGTDKLGWITNLQEHENIQKLIDHIIEITYINKSILSQDVLNKLSLYLNSEYNCLNLENLLKNDNDITYEYIMDKDNLDNFIKEITSMDIDDFFDESDLRINEDYNSMIYDKNNIYRTVYPSFKTFIYKKLSEKILNTFRKECEENPEKKISIIVNGSNQELQQFIWDSRYRENPNENIRYISSSIELDIFENDDKKMSKNLVFGGRTIITNYYAIIIPEIKISSIADLLYFKSVKESESPLKEKYLLDVTTISLNIENVNTPNTLEKLYDSVCTYNNNYPNKIVDDELSVEFYRNYIDYSFNYLILSIYYGTNCYDCDDEEQLKYKKNIFLTKNTYPFILQTRFIEFNKKTRQLDFENIMIYQYQ